MITVEELIVQSLYYRLVVVNVKRTEDEAPQSKESKESKDGRRQRQDSSSLGPDSPVHPSPPPSNMGPGLGEIIITYVNL
jgi:hypothetical protein